LSGPRQVDLYKSGYERYRKIITFDTLQGVPQFSVVLVKKAGEDTTNGTVPVVRGTRTPKGGISSNPRRPDTKGTKKASRRVAQVELRDGYIRGEPNKKIQFTQNRTLFAKGSMAIKLSSRYQATVKAYSRIKRNRVFLEAFAVVLYVKRRKGWRKAYTKVIELDEPLQRPVVVQSSGVRKVRVVTRALRLDRRELKEDVKDALKRGIKAVLARDKARR
jgi:hypothetical protein